MTDISAEGEHGVPGADDSSVAVRDAWKNEQWGTAAGFCQALEDPSANLELLRWLSTPESRDRWGDFSEVAAHFATIEDPAFGSVVNPAFGAEDVGYFKIFRGVTQSYQRSDEELVLLPAVITLVFHPFEERWMVEAYGDAVRPEAIPCRTGDSARWDGPQRRRFTAVPEDAWLTQHGTMRMDGSKTFNFPEQPRWARERFIELDVSMIEGRVSVAEAVRARRGMSPVRPKDRVRYFHAQDLYNARYIPCRTPNRVNPKHVSVYGNMTEIGAWVPPGQEQLLHVDAHRRWWDRPGRVTLGSMAEGSA